MSRPIPRSRLPHTISLAKYSGDDETGDGFDSAVTIENVFFQRKTTRKPTANGFQIIGQVLILIDPITSKFDGDILVLMADIEKSEITFNGETFTVNENFKTPDNVRSFHHWELICL